MKIFKLIETWELERVFEALVLQALLDPDIGELLVRDAIVRAIYLHRWKEVGIEVKPFRLFVGLIKGAYPVVVAPPARSDPDLVKQATRARELVHIRLPRLCCRHNSREVIAPRLYEPCGKHLMYAASDCGATPKGSRNTRFLSVPCTRFHLFSAIYFLGGWRLTTNERSPR